MKKYTIYRIFDTVNRKFYIGRTTTSLIKRWSVHKAHTKYYERYTKNIGKDYLHACMRKYGIENFEIKEIDSTDNFKHLVFLEGFYIKYYNSIDPKYGYNLTIDSYGDGLEFVSEETRKKKSINAHQSNSGGVTWDKSRNKWIFRCKKLNITKRFINKIDAEIFRDKLYLYLYKENVSLFYREKREEYLKEDLEQFYKNALNNKFKPSNKYKGITEHNGLFNVRLYKPRIFVGCFKNEEEAKIQFDKVSYYLYGENYKLDISNELKEIYKLEGERIYKHYTNPQNKGMMLTKKPRASKYKGISKSTKYLWEASLIVNKKRWRQTFYSEKEAAIAFNNKVIELGLPKERLNIITD